MNWRRTIVAAACLVAFAAPAQRYVYIEDVPDYLWHAGCFGTATGNLAGYWDRNGFPNFYTGPTGGGVAPLSSGGSNVGIQSLWASEGGLDGRPRSSPGHIDDYWVAYESAVPDPYYTAGRREHRPDSIGDFIGLNQQKWTGELMNDECYGNIDAYSFVYWDKRGGRRENFVPVNIAGLPQTDIQSGLPEWTKYRGYEADVFTQVMDHEAQEPGLGFTFENLKAEIEAGYPILIFLQKRNEISRRIGGKPFNPEMHAVLAYGYMEDAPELGIDKGVVIRTSWGTGDDIVMEWNTSWFDYLPARGVIGYRPKPKITQVRRTDKGIEINWDGPSGTLFDVVKRESRPLHRYQLERATSLHPDNFEPVGNVITERQTVISETGTAFYRVRLTN